MKPVEAHLSSGWQAELHLGFTRRGEATLLSDCRHRGPLRVQKALYPEGEAVCQAIVLHPPSGIAGGDHLNIHVDAASGARAQCTTPGAGKWYRSGGPDASQRLHFRVADEAVLEWLPQETIVFDGARAHMDTRVHLTGTARYIGWDILCLGRAAAGERFRQGRIDLSCRIERDGRPIWLERGSLHGDDPMLASPAGWGGATVCATLIATAPPAPDLLAACRAIAPADGARHALTALPGVLIARYLGDSSEAARLWLADIWTLLRPAILGRPALPPRIWNT